MTITRVCVLGAPADQGQPLVAELLGAGFEVTAGVRRADAMKDTPWPDLPTVHADITDADAMAKAFEGQDAAAFHLPFEFDRAKAAHFGKCIAEGAKRAGLKKIVFNTACYVADHDLDLSAHDGRRDIERALEETGITCVFIEPTVFMDNQYRIWTRPLIMRDGIFSYPAKPDLLINWVCLEDVAQAMRRALQTDAADGSVLAIEICLRAGRPACAAGRAGGADGRPGCGQFDRGDRATGAVSEPRAGRIRRPYERACHRLARSAAAIDL